MREQYRCRLGSGLCNTVSAPCCRSEYVNNIKRIIKAKVYTFLYKNVVCRLDLIDAIHVTACSPRSLSATRGLDSFVEDECSTKGTSPCLASYASCKRDTARIRCCAPCCGAAAVASAVQQSIDIPYPPGAQQQTRSSGVWRATGANGGTDGQTDARPSRRPCSAYCASVVNNWT